MLRVVLNFSDLMFHLFHTVNKSFLDLSTVNLAEPNKRRGPFNTLFYHYYR